MSKKAPDTRNRLDNNRNSKPKSKTQKFTQKELKEELKTISLKIKVEKKPSKGNLFKTLHGYSKTLKRNMNKHNLNPVVYSDSINEYKGIRKKRKLSETKTRQNKHQVSVTYKRLNGKKRVVRTQGKKSKSSKVAETSKNKKK